MYTNIYSLATEIAFLDFKAAMARRLRTSGEDTRGNERGAKGNDITEDKARKSTNAD